jgi:hypothetical protein
MILDDDKFDEDERGVFWWGVVILALAVASCVGVQFLT